MGQRITRQLEVKNLSQSELARILGISRMTVSQWCTNTSEPKPENLLNLAHVLFDGDADYLVHGPSRQPEGGFPTSPRLGPRMPAGGGDTGSSGSFTSPFRRRKT